MEMCKFHLFMALPVEPRLQIWKQALPSPQIIKPLFSNKIGNGYYRPWRLYYGGSWFWATINAASITPLVFVNKEARKVGLEHYDAIAICNQTGLSRDVAHTDWSCDTFYFTKHTFQKIHNIASGHFDSVEDPTPWINQIQNLALSARSKVIRDISPFSGFRRFFDFKCPESKSLAIKYLVSVIETFPALTQLILIIDGRNKSSNGPTEIVEPTAAFPDYYISDGREKVLQWLSDVRDELQGQQSSRKIPTIRLGLLINRTNNDEPDDMARRWDYTHARCRFVLPESTTSDHPSSGSSASSESSDDDSAASDVPNFHYKYTPLSGS